MIDKSKKSNFTKATTNLKRVFEHRERKCWMLKQKTKWKIKRIKKFKCEYDHFKVDPIELAHIKYPHNLFIIERNEVTKVTFQSFCPLNFDVNRHVSISVQCFLNKKEENRCSLGHFSITNKSKHQSICCTKRSRSENFEERNLHEQN